MSIVKRVTRSGLEYRLRLPKWNKGSTGTGEVAWWNCSLVTPVVLPDSHLASRQLAIYWQGWFFARCQFNAKTDTFFFFQSPLQLSCNIQILCSTIFEVVHVLNIFTPIKGAMKTKYSSLEKLLCPDNNGTNFMANWINSGDIKQNMLTSGSSLATFQQLFSVASQSHVCAIGNCQTNPSLRQMTAWL